MMDAVSIPAGPDPRPDAPEPAEQRSYGPRPLAKPARSALSLRDMAGAMGLLAVVVLLVGGLAGVWTFAPAGPTVDPRQLPVVDAPAELRALAPGLGFGLRIPAVPPDWRSNSVGVDRVGESGSRSVRTGYLTPQGRYLRVLQSTATEAELLTVETGTRPVAGRGAEDVGGQRWVVYGDRPEEPIWIGEIAGQDPVRILITGSGTDEDFRTLATATSTGEVVGGP